MKIVHKLSLLVLIASITAWFVAYLGFQESEKVLRAELSRSSQLRAQAVMREVSRSLRDRVTEWQAMRRDPSLQKLIEQSNLKFERQRNLEELIERIDKKWIAKGSTFSIAKKISAHSTSSRLRTWTEEFEQELGYPLYPQAFLTNRYGVVVAQTSATDDYLQSDEGWWNSAVKEGIDVGDVKLYDSLGVFGFPVALRIDNAKGEHIGVLQVVINVQEIFSIIDESAQPYEKVVLFDGKNRVLKISGMEDAPFSLSKELLMPVGLGSDSQGWNYEVDDSATSEKLLQSYARFDSIEWFKRLGLKVLLEQSAERVFAPGEALRNRVIKYEIFGISLCLILGMAVSWSISRRLWGIVDMTKEIAEGRAPESFVIKGRDEIARVSRTIASLAQSLDVADDEVKKFARIAEKTDNSVLLMDLNGCIEWVNEGFTRITEYSLDEVVGRTPEDVLSGAATNTDTLANIASNRERRVPYRAQLLNYTKSGKSYWVDSRIQPIKNDADDVIQFMAIESDISELKEKEELLNEALQTQRAVNGILELSHSHASLEYKLEQALDIVAEQDCIKLTSEAGILLVKEQGSSTLELVVQKDLPAPFFAEEGDGSSEQAAEQRQNIPFNVDISDGDELLGVIVCYFEPEHKVSETEKGYLETVAGAFAALIVRDRSFSELTDAREEALESTRLKSEFMASISHELRTPLSTIVGTSQRLLKKLDDSLSEREVESLETVDRNAKHLLNFINDIHDLARIEAGKMVLEMTRFDLAGTARDIVASLSPLAKAKGLELDIAIPETELSVIGDRSKISQIITNLVSNAVRYTSSGRISFALEPKTGGSVNDSIVIRVVDTGVGLSDDEITALFTQFARIGREDRESKGMGIGLVISKHYVDMHRGIIDVTSHPGEGTTFMVTMPIMVRTVKEHDDVIETVTSPAFEVKTTRILCVDDDPEAVTSLSGVFEEEGYQVGFARSRAEAIHAVEEKHVDILFLDISFHEGDTGQIFDSVGTIKGIDKVPTVVVASSESFSLEGDKRITCYLSKPTEVENIVTQLNTAANSTLERLLVVEDCDDTAQLLMGSVDTEKVECTRAVNSDEAIELLEQEEFSAVMLDIKLPQPQSVSLMEKLDKSDKETSLFMIAVNELAPQEIEFLEDSTDSFIVPGKDTAVRLIESILKNIERSSLQDEGLIDSSVITAVTSDDSEDELRAN